MFHYVSSDRREHGPEGNVSSLSTMSQVQATRPAASLTMEVEGFEVTQYTEHPVHLLNTSTHGYSKWPSHLQESHLFSLTLPTSSRSHRSVLFCLF